MIEVYGEITAVVSSHVIGLIQESGGDALLTLHKYVQSARPAHVLNGQNRQYTLTGSLEDINAAKNELIGLLERLKSPDGLLDEFCTQEDKPVFTPAENFPSTEPTHSSDNKLIADDAIELDGQCDGFKYSSHITPPQKIGLVLRSSLMASQKCLCRSVLKRKSRKSRRLDPDVLSKNLEKMKLSEAENSSDGESLLTTDSSIEKLQLKTAKDYESSTPFKYFCQICSFKSKRSSHFEKHTLLHNKMRSLFKCSTCNFTSLRQSHLRRHEMTHSSACQACSQCNYKTDDVKLLLRHVRFKHCKAHRAKFAVVLSCPDCSFQTTRPHNFERHKLFDCNKQGSTVYQCEKCSYKTNRKEHYNRHFQSIHVNERNYLCHLCGKAFKRGDALQQHHLTHEEKDSSNTNFKCDICEKLFKSHSHLVEHKAVHSDARLFLCEVCGASFKTRSVQRKHIATIHRNPRSYSCTTCGKRFNTLFAMKRHQKLHMGAKASSVRHSVTDSNEVSTSDSTEELKRVRVTPVTDSGCNSRNSVLQSCNTISVTAATSSQVMLSVNPATTSSQNEVTTSTVFTPQINSLFVQSQNVDTSEHCLINPSLQL